MKISQVVQQVNTSKKRNIIIYSLSDKRYKQKEHKEQDMTRKYVYNIKNRI